VSREEGSICEEVEIVGTIVLFNILIPDDTTGFTLFEVLLVVELCEVLAPLTCELLTAMFCEIPDIAVCDCPTVL
jgi:hypothetical protein